MHMPLERIQKLVDDLKKSEAKLDTGKRMTMRDQQIIQEEIKKIKLEIATLERRVGSR